MSACAAIYSAGVIAQRQFRGVTDSQCAGTPSTTFEQKDEPL
jgi:hypothetical protein